MQQESPRVCKICGGPNHYGCGCEARQKRAAVQVETEGIKSTEQPASEMPAEYKIYEALESFLSPEVIIQSHKSNMRMAKDIQTMADGFEGLCACFYDTNNLLKIIAGDLITIRKSLTKEDEVKNADPDNPEKNQN